MENGLNFGLQFTKMLGGLALILGLMAVAVYALKRLNPRLRKTDSSHWIQVVAQHPLSIKHNLLLVQVKDKLLLLGVSPQGVHFLTLIQEDSDSSTGAAP